MGDQGAQMTAFATTGRIRRPLITVAGTMDGLLPIDHHARAYARKVAAAERSGGGDDEGDRDDRRPAYRLYEVQNGNHIETYQDTFPQLELIEPHAQRAFDLLVQHVELGAALPESQCIPHGGALAAAADQATARTSSSPEAMRLAGAPLLSGGASQLGYGITAPGAEGTPHRAAWSCSARRSSSPASRSEASA